MCVCVCVCVFQQHLDSIGVAAQPECTFYFFAFRGGGKWGGGGGGEHATVSFPTIVFKIASVQFSSVWFLFGLKGPYALHPVPQKLPRPVAFETCASVNVEDSIRIG